MTDVTDETDSISTASAVSTKDTVKEDLDSQEKRLELSVLIKKEYWSRMLALLLVSRRWFNLFTQEINKKA